MIVNSTDKARESYEAFLELVSDDPELRAEAMRRLGDLELDATESQELADDLDALDGEGFENAVDLFSELLEAYPDYRRNDTVLYQLARAYEAGGQMEDSLRVLNELVAKHPDTEILHEVQFRRGEMLFLRRDYAGAEDGVQRCGHRRGILAVLRTISLQAWLVAVQTGDARRKPDAVFRSCWTGKLAISNCRMATID